MKKEAPTFWVTNICGRNVSLSDLDLTIKAFTSVNLLDMRHYDYTIEQLRKSVDSGSIYNKRNIIKERVTVPEVLKANVPFIRETFIPTRERSLYTIKEDNYEELNVSDEQFAIDNADLADEDAKPMIKKV